MKTELKTLVGAILGMICLLSSGNFALGREVQLEELSISLYNKPVTGFRVVLDRSERFVSNQIIAHVAASDPTPAFQYERSIIYENIRYLPIDEDHDLSLYYILKGVQGQYTELTLVAMYDYRRSISTRDFPALANNLKIDLARFVRKTTGDYLRSGDLLYDDALLSQLQPAPTKAANAGNQPDVEHFKEEEVENAKVLIHKDPFAKGSQQTTPGDTSLAKLKERINYLEKREQELMASERELRSEQANLQRQQELLMEKVKQNKSLRDSVSKLNQRVQSLVGQSYVSDDVSVSNETAGEMARLSDENKRLEQLNARLKTQNDSLQKVSRRYAQELAQISEGGKGNSDEMAKLEKENAQLRQQLKSMEGRSGNQASAAELDSLRQALDDSRSRQMKMQSENEQMRQANGRMKEDNDFLHSKKTQLEERIVILEADLANFRAGSDNSNDAKLSNSHVTDSLNAELRNMRRQLSSTKIDMAQVKTERDQLQANSDRQEQLLESKERERANLEARLKQMQAGGNNNDANYAELLAKRDSIQILQKELDENEVEMGKLRREIKAKEAEKTDALAMKDAEISSLQSQMRESANGSNPDPQITEADMQAKRDSIVRMERQLTEAGKQMAQLKQDMKAAADRQGKLLAAKEEEKAILEAKIREMEADLGSRPAAGTADNSAQLKSKQDSIARLSQQLTAANSQISQLKKDMEANSNYSAELQTKERRIQTLETEQASLNAKLQEIQKERAALQKSLAEANGKLGENQNSRNVAEQELAKLQQRHKNLESSFDSQNESMGKLAAENAHLQDSLRSLNKANNGLKNDISGRDRTIAAQSSQKDSLNKAIAQANFREKDLLRSISLMQTRMDSLSRSRLPEGEQQKFIKEQWTRLEQWEKELAGKDQSSKDKDKLLAQRESVVQQKEKDLETRELRFKDLEEREKRIALMETQINSQTSGHTIENLNPNVKESRVVEYGNQVPVFVVEVPGNTREIQKRIVYYMLSRDEMYNDQFPELIYRAAKLSELDAQPIEAKFRLESKGNNTVVQVSFKLDTGEYLGGDRYRERSESAKQLIIKMMRYKP